MRTAMMAMTTSNSINVKPDRVNALRERKDMGDRPFCRAGQGADSDRGPRSAPEKWSAYRDARGRSTGTLGRQVFWLTVGLCLFSSLFGVVLCWEVETRTRTALGVPGTIILVSVVLFVLSALVRGLSVRPRMQQGG